ncbi:TadE family protein [Microbacterium sp. zg.Y1090]|uniref:TadE family protein n=1 Tax=Microbacterium TaxID=33882 RepID=UPI00214B079D|nr:MULTISPECIES: TadE family protein [unclassified Microbacterium]MCR2811513.1 TadE family protein [Microbacterium sp. zg.Y1084]MCR2819068.1 TadE family protein [Microbacterium sp. zg.Y1090]MDL5487714.1 TadE family protein [Microbacterium sp. zg-Y1211]WIM27372.1 TadE family protein [Microbacterium sp. zg-Y1090]
MPRRRPWSDAVAEDDGAAALEFILVGVILLVPLVYLVVALGAVQSQTLGAEAGARHIARAVATAPDAATAAARTERVLASVVDEYALSADAVDVSITCVPVGVACPAAGATLRVTIATRVTLPLVPAVLGWEHLAAVPVEATAVQKVSRFWSGP